LAHLYTRLAAGRETDEIEMWLKQDFEDPAVLALQKATAGAPLDRKDWRLLIRFLAAQIVRTPAHFNMNLPRWKQTIVPQLESTLKDVVQYAKLAATLGVTVDAAGNKRREMIPIRVDRYADHTGSTGKLKASVIVGRGLWHFEMKSILEGEAAAILHEHKWSILSPCRELTWFTTDDPVVMLNYYEPDKYDFGGGSGSMGTEILFPLSPRHLMYTRIGAKPPKRGEEMSLETTLMLRRFIAEHGHRFIFAQTPDQGVTKLRPRAVNQATFVEEKQALERWHEDQVRAETDLFNRN
jgi:hypothetical protein